MRFISYFLTFFIFLLYINVSYAGFFDKLDKITNTVDSVDNTINKVDRSTEKTSNLHKKIADRLTPENQKTVNKWKASVAETSKRVHKACGKKIKITLDASVNGPFLESLKDAGNYCSEAVNAIPQSLCPNPDFREGVRDQIESIKCVYDSTTKGQVKLKFKGSSLLIGYSPDTPNLNTDTLKWLEGRL